MLEYANNRFMSDWPNARKLTTAIDRIASVISIHEIAGLNPKTLKNILASAYMPNTFIETPESIAETGAGAEECA